MAEQLSQEYGIELKRATTDVSALLQVWEDTLFVDSSTRSGVAHHFRRESQGNIAVSEQYRVNDQVIRVSFGDPRLAEEISPRLESFLTIPGEKPDLEFNVWSEKGLILLANDSAVLSTEENPNAIRAILLQEMVRRTEQGRDWLAVLHAGACGEGDSCVLLAGKSHSGKSTLCAALMASGMKLYSDDSAAIGGEQMTVSPMPFRLMLREGSWNVLLSRFPEISSSPTFLRYGQSVRFLAPRPEQVPSSPATPKALLFVSFVPDREARLEPLTSFEALLRLRESGFWVRHEQEGIAAFLKWLATLPAFEFTYPSLEGAVSVVKTLSAQ